MEPLINEFQVPAPIDRAWEVLTDIERIAPCMPGAQLQEIEGDEYRGIVKVKVGPITAQYKGTATVTESDESERRMVIDASGRDTRGQGNASALITLTMAEAGDATDVSVHTDLKITGKVAQFGRGMLGEVSNKLLGEFVDCLGTKLDEPEAVAPDEAATGDDASGDDAAGDAPDAVAAAVPSEAATEPKPAVRKIDGPEAAPVDLMDAAGSSVAKRALPLIVVVIILILLGRRRSHDE